MYRKYMNILVLINCIAGLAICSVMGLNINSLLADEAFLQGVRDENCVMVTKENYSLTEAASGERIVQIDVSERSNLIEISNEDYDSLLKIVEAEAGGEDEKGKMLVANVVLNRVSSDKFPDTVTEVVYQKSKGKAQFSPVGSGRIERVKISEETKKAVDRVLEGEDYSEGALYFAARKYANPKKMSWFDTKLMFLFAHGGHEFFKEQPCQK